jgi:hypothetical protein
MWQTRVHPPEALHVEELDWCHHANACVVNQQLQPTVTNCSLHLLQRRSNTLLPAVHTTQTYATAWLACVMVSLSACACK